MTTASKLVLVNVVVWYRSFVDLIDRACFGFGECRGQSSMEIRTENCLLTVVNRNFQYHFPCFSPVDLSNGGDHAFLSPVQGTHGASRAVVRCTTNMK